MRANLALIFFIKFICMKVLLIYTGGTIGMVKDSESNALKTGSVDVVKAYVKKEFPDEAISYSVTKEAIDSSNFNLRYYEELATLVEDAYSQYDAFLILMGTDTMSYVSSLLSYCTEGLSKPIVFTGGQLPLYNKNSDSKHNLKGALKGLLSKEFSNEVGIYFCNKWMRAVLTTKIDTQDLDAYEVPNPNSRQIDYNSENFHIVKKITSEIEIFKISPFSNLNFLKQILVSVNLNGIILEVFGSGNFPDLDDELVDLLRSKINNGLRLVVVSQCLRGGVDFGKYQASLQVKSLGFISGGFLTTESALAKMLYLSTKELNDQQYQGFFKKSIRGES